MIMTVPSGETIMLPEGWLDFVFPEELRKKSEWIDLFGHSRRIYMLGFSQAAKAVGRGPIVSIHAGRSAIFKEDPRRYIPLSGWRDRFYFHGETFVDGACRADRHLLGQTYKYAPHEPLREDCKKWGQYGKDQPEHAHLKRPMRLFDALKSIAALHDARDQTEQDVSIEPSRDGRSHSIGQISLHVAIFRISGFDEAYYKRHFRNEPGLLRELFAHCELDDWIIAEAPPTFEEMAYGLSATKRTCENLISFCEKKEMPALGSINQEYGPRGRLRNVRRDIKNDTRKGIFEKYSADCAIEIFKN